ncbi:MAG: hypothetical protein K9N35_11790 [Candidatus Marinimicrobia bacterium]|nr:hypothetical protein [Candidatus Neomarinimicrobiota bacterium]
MSHSIKQKLLLITAISIAFAFIESSVVTYLRELFYPEGFHFPIKEIPHFLILVELGREAATIVLLLGLAFLAGHSQSERFAYFSLAFGVWDIFFYIWLKILINWPESLFTWDILFLIPLPWTGPVISPVLVSLALIFAACTILHYEEHRGRPFFLSRLGWLAEFFALVLILWSYLWNAKNIGADESALDYPYSLFVSGLLLGVIIFAIHVWDQYFRQIRTSGI